MSQRSLTPYRPLRHITQDEQEWFTGILRNSDFCLYGTFTFANEVDSQQAKVCFDSFINICSRSWPGKGDNVGFIVAEEAALSGLSNFKVKRHLHAVMMSNRPLSPEAIQGHWSRVVGNALVESYNFQKNGIGYILKKRDDEHCDWRISDNLYLFVEGYEGRNKAERQALKRHLLRRSASQARRVNSQENIP